MVEGCCKAMYVSPRVKVTGFEMQYWNDAGKGDEENETTIAIKSEMKDLEVRKNSEKFHNFYFFSLICHSCEISRDTP